MMKWTFLAVLIPSLTSLLGTELVRRYALRTSMIDVPNERSSHTIPTPRGGGVAIAFSVLGALALLSILMPDQSTTTLGILGGGLVIALVGLLDDRFNLSARSRLVVQFAASIWLLSFVWSGNQTSGSKILGSELLGGDVLSTNWFWVLVPAAVVFLVWCTNLYNFMDGLDGFAGGQAVIAAIAAAMICFAKQDLLLGYLMLSTAGAAAGFLVWNWPPAKIFMGDCGSGFLGFLFGATILVGNHRGSIPLFAGLMLILVFLGDSTLTLVRRMLAKEAWYRPHRSHAYQLATQLGASHQQVTVASLVAFAVAGMLAVGISLRADMGATLFVGYAIVIFGVWLLINVLIVGRHRVMASISSLDEKRTVGAVNANASSDVDGPVGSPATSLYLRMRSLQTRLLVGRSDMPKKDLLSEVTGVASELGYHVSHDWLDGCGGGRCEVAGEKWILLDFNMSRQDQVKQIILAIHEEMDRAEAMSDELRSAVVRTAGPTSPDEVVRRAA